MFCELKDSKMVGLEGVASYQIGSAWSPDHARACMRVHHAARDAGLQPHVPSAARCHESAMGAEVRQIHITGAGMAANNGPAEFQWPFRSALSLLSHEISAPVYHSLLAFHRLQLAGL